MADNVTVGIGADTSKLRADLAVAQAEVRQFGTELRAAAKESLETGDKSAVADLAGKYDAAAKKVTDLKGALVTTKPELQEHANLHQQLSGHLATAHERLSALHGSVTALGATMGNIATNIFPGFNQIFLAFGAVSSVAGIYELVKGAAEWGHKLDGLAQSMGASQNMVKTWASAAKEGAVEFDQLASGLIRFEGKLEGSADKQRSIYVSMAEQLAKLGGDSVLRPDPPSEWAQGHAKIEAMQAPTFTGSKEQREKAQKEFDAKKANALNQYDAENSHKRAPPKLIDFGDPEAFGYGSRDFDVAFGSYQETLASVTKRMEQGGLGAAGLQLPDFDRFLDQYRATLNRVDKEGQEFRDKHTKAGGDIAAKTTIEQLERQMPGFKDSLISAGVDPLKQFGNETKDAASALREFLLGFQKMGESKQVATIKELMGRGAITPEMLNLLRKPVGTPGSLFPNGVEQGKNADVQHAAELFEQIHRFETAIGGLKKTIGLAFGDVFEPLFSGLAKGLEQSKPELKAWATEVAQNIAPAIKEMVGMLSGKGATSEFGQTLTALGTIIRGVASSFDNIKLAATAAGIAIGGIVFAIGLVPTAVLTAAALAKAALERLVEYIYNGLKDVAISAFASIEQGINTLVDFLKGVDWGSLFAPLKGAIDSVLSWLDRLISKASSAASALAQALGLSGGSPGATADLPPPIPPPSGNFAAGGMIRGPGTGTSDSILARVSTGEYVLNAASTASLGTRFLDGLNSIGRYAMGGLVGPTLPAFAGGGSVGGGNLTLNIGNRSFHASMRGGVLSELAHEARTHDLLSLGPTPSWHGGRR